DTGRSERLRRTRQAAGSASLPSVFSSLERRGVFRSSDEPTTNLLRRDRLSDFRDPASSLWCEGSVRGPRKLPCWPTGGARPVERGGSNLVHGSPDAARFTLRLGGATAARKPRMNNR